MRAYLKTFELPGESELVDRIMQKFGSKYLSDNPGTFNSPDGVYTFCYLLMMVKKMLF